jgi:hypothetical protein
MARVATILSDLLLACRNFIFNIFYAIELNF